MIRLFLIILLVLLPSPVLSAQQLLENNQSMGVQRTKINDNFTELYGNRIGNGTAVLGTSQIADQACAPAVSSYVAGVVAGDIPLWTFASDPTSVVGYNPTGGLLYIVTYVTTDYVNFKVCNKSGAAITPGAMSLYWRVLR